MKQQIVELPEHQRLYWMQIYSDLLGAELERDRLMAAVEDAAFDVEPLAGAVHDAYIEGCRKFGWNVAVHNLVPYERLSERAKELDRITVRSVLSALIRRVKKQEEK